MNAADFNELSESDKKHFYKCNKCGEMVDMRQLDDVLFHEDHIHRSDIDAVDRCREGRHADTEVFTALDLLARRTSTRWPFEQFRESLNFAVGDASHAEGHSERNQPFR